MSAIQSLQFPRREQDNDLWLVKIMTGVYEDNLFKKFLSRGSALARNPEIKKLVRQFGYYSVLYANWCEFEKSFIFLSTSHRMRPDFQAPGNHPEPSNPSPMFVVQLVGNCILLPNEFWDKEREWLLQNKQEVLIADMVINWLSDWKIEARIESSIPITNVREIDKEARRLRELVKTPRPKSTYPAYPRYQKTRKLYSHKLANWAALIEQATNDLSCLEKTDL